MLVTRFENSATSTNLQALLTLIQDPNCQEVRLFASPSSRTSDFSNSDGPETNLPLVSALAKYSVPGITDVYVLFDGAFLTAARKPRLGEVQALLNAAETSGKTVFSTAVAPFTSSIEVEVAVKLLLALAPTTSLTATSRPLYFAQISSIPEKEYPV